MGVKLSDIVEKRGISFGDLKGKKIAVDFSNAAYQFLSSIRQRDGTPLMSSSGKVTSHLQGILSRSANLISQGVKLVYVTDGPPPELKVSTQEHRHNIKVSAEDKYESAKEEGDFELMLKYSKQFIRLTKEMTEESKELIKALGMPVLQAPSEADAQIAYICKNGDAWAGASSDFDNLLHGCPRILTNLTLSQRRKTSTGAIILTNPELIELDEVLKKLNINQSQLIALGILTGTDYHPGIKGVGPKKALKIVTELKTPEKIFEKYPLDNQNWKEIFKLFTEMKVTKSYKLEWNPPDVKKVLKILVDKNEFSEERVMSAINKMIGLETKAKVTSDQKGLGSWM